MENIHAGHRDRMKKEFLANGIENLPQHKVLELLLFFCISRIDTNPLAHELIERYKNIAGVLDAPIEELITFKGLTESNAVLLKMIIPLARIYAEDKESKDIQFKSIDSIGDYLLKRYFGLTKEMFSILCIDASGKLLSFNFLSEGDISSVGVSTRSVIEIALKSNANCAIISHNHPSGIALPSNEDVAVTEQVRNALYQIGVRLVDHIIIADGDFVSMQQSQKYKHLFY